MFRKVSPPSDIFFVSSERLISCISDPLAFRPNIQNLAVLDQGEDDTHDYSMNRKSIPDDDGVYHPPKVAPVPYNEASSSSNSKTKKSARSAPIAKALSSLAHLDPSMPHSESVSGLGGGGSETKSSAVRARLDEITRFEEDNMTRMLLNKKESKKRLRDEADIALGGMGGGGRARVGGGLEEEFDDILKSVSRSKSSKFGDGYEDLRHRSKKEDAFSRSRTRKQPDDDMDADADVGGRGTKRSKFERDVSKVKKKRARR